MKNFYIFTFLSFLTIFESLSAMQQQMQGPYAFQEPMSEYEQPFPGDPYARHPGNYRHPVRSAPNFRNHLSHRVQHGSRNSLQNQQRMLGQNMQNGYMNSYPNQQGMPRQNVQQEIALGFRNLNDTYNLLRLRSNGRLICNEQTAEMLYRENDNSPDIIQWRIDCRAYLASKHALTALAQETNTPIPQNPNQTGNGFIGGMEEIVEAPIDAAGAVAEGVVNGAETAAEDVWGGLKKIF